MTLAEALAAEAPEHRVLAEGLMVRLADRLREHPALALATVVPSLDSSHHATAFGGDDHRACHRSLADWCSQHMTVGSTLIAVHTCHVSRPIDANDSRGPDRVIALRIEDWERTARMWHANYDTPASTEPRWESVKWFTPALLTVPAVVN